jgi:antitoxin YefM
MQISYSALRQNLRSTLDSVVDLNEPTVITSHHKPTAVLISYDDYQSLKETAYLLRSPANAKRLLDALISIEKGGDTKDHPLLDDET